MSSPLQVSVIGGGMIVNDLILPTLYDLQRHERIGDIAICARGAASLRALADNPDLAEAFPGQSFLPHPALDATGSDPDRYRKLLAAMPPRQIVVVALPDQLHFTVVMEALERDQHVLCVKPLVLTHRESVAIAERARERGLFVGVEYHKRFDRRALVARRDYALGKFGEFVLGEARLIEPYYYRHSNFQEWFTCDQTDPFVYVGCHYTDLLQFITGLRPTEVAVKGVKGRFPNGQEGYLWSTGRVTYSNGGILTVANGLGYPDAGAGGNDQGMLLYCEGEDCSGLIRHDDHYRGVSHAYAAGTGAGGSVFNFVNPDFFRLIPWAGEGYRPIGYGVDSVVAIVEAILAVDASSDDPASRQQTIAQIEARGLIATPANSADNERLMEAARESILGNGKAVAVAR